MNWNSYISRTIVLLAAIVVSTLSQSCTISYKFNGASLGSEYKTIAVGEFPIRAALVYPPLQQMFENNLLDYITRNTRLTISDNKPDLELDGEITGYTLTPQAVSEDAYASKTRLTISVRVKFVNNMPDELKGSVKDLDQTFSAYRDFDASQMLTDVQDELCQQISKELVDLIFNATLGNW